MHCIYQWIGHRFFCFLFFNKWDKSYTSLICMIAQSFTLTNIAFASTQWSSQQTQQNTTFTSTNNLGPFCRNKGIKLFVNYSCVYIRKTTKGSSVQLSKNGHSYLWANRVLLFPTQLTVNFSTALNKIRHNSTECQWWMLDTFLSIPAKLFLLNLSHFWTTWQEITNSKFLAANMNVIPSYIAVHFK